MNSSTTYVNKWITSRGEVLDFDDAPVKLFRPHPPGHPQGHHFFKGCPGLLITLFIPCPALYINTLISLFFKCPALIHHTHFSSNPRASPEGEMGAEQFDQRIMKKPEKPERPEDFSCQVSTLYMVHYWTIHRVQQVIYY